ncbi:MAG: hypothetical protein ACYSR6_11955 [Planctomycetota bacterium]|jgi:predicted nuclease of predicted toxin-antitoxin system
MKNKIGLPLVTTIAVLVIGIGCTATHQNSIAFRSVVFDTAFLQGRKGTPRVDDVVRANLKEEITLRGVWAAPPKYHVEVWTLVETENYTIVTVRDDLIEAFDENVYSDAVLRLKDDSLCRVQHSYKENDGVTIRLVRDSAVAYIKPNRSDAGDGS